MESYRPYPCTKCGLCCRFVNYVEELSGYDTGDGTCCFLNDDNTCSIYLNRPDVCNGKYVYENYYNHMTVDDFHSMMLKYCKEIQEGTFLYYKKHTKNQ